MEFDVIIGKGCNALIDWGPGIVIAIVMLFGLYKLVTKIGLKIVEALDKPTAALTQQANSMDALTKSLQEYVMRDRNEHREIIILLKVLNDRFEELKNKLDEKEEKAGDTHG